MHGVPERAIDDRRVRRLEILIPALQFGAVCPAVQDLVQRTPVVELAHVLPSGLRRPVLIAPAARPCLLSHLHQRADLDESPEQRPHLFGLCLVNHQPPILEVVAEGVMPYIHIPFFLLAANLSRMRSDVSSRSNWAKVSKMFSNIRPIASVVLNCWVTDTKVTPCRSKTFTSSAKS